MDSLEAITWKSQKPLALESPIAVAWFSTLRLHVGNQKPGCSSNIVAAHIPSLHFDSGSRFIKWSGAQNRVCIAKLETLVNFIWTLYYDDFIVIWRKGDRENASVLKTWVPVVCIVKCTAFIYPMCEGSAICRFFYPLCVWPQHKSCNTYIASREPGIIHCIRSVPFRKFKSLQLFPNISEASGSFCLQWYYVLAPSRRGSIKSWHPACPQGYVSLGLCRLPGIFPSRNTKLFAPRTSWNLHTQNQAWRSATLTQKPPQTKMQSKLKAGTAFFRAMWVKQTNFWNLGNGRWKEATQRWIWNTYFQASILALEGVQVDLFKFRWLERSMKNWMGPYQRTPK